MIKEKRREKIINKENIDREYLEALDKEIEMIPLTFDPVFKSVLEII